MRKHFGDYRAKMKSEQKTIEKLQQNLKNMKFDEKVDTKQMEKSKCIKKKTDASEKTATSIKIGTKNEEKEFKFNFQVENKSN